MKKAAESGKGMTRRKALGHIAVCYCCGAGALSMAGIGAAWAQAQPGRPPSRPGPPVDSIPEKFPPENPKWKTEFKQLAPNIYAYVQAGGPGINNIGISNSGCIVGPDGMMAVDSLSAPLLAKAYIQTATQTTGKKFNRLVNTHHHNDHSDCNLMYQPAEIVGSAYCQQVLTRSIGLDKSTYWDKREGFADGTEEWRAVPPTVVVKDKLTYQYGDLTVECIALGPAHTWGDVMVHVPKHKVLFIGDVGFFGVRPAAWSGHVSGWIERAAEILAMDVDVIVPGHGHVGGKNDIAALRDYFVALKREAKLRFDAGMTPEQAAADITLGGFEWAETTNDVSNVRRLFLEFKGTIRPLPSI